MNYETKDFYLSAFLVASGFSIIHYKREAGLTTFAFRQTHELMEFIQNYYADHISVSPIRFGNSLKNLKCLIHSYTDNGKQQLTHNLGAQA